WRNTGNSGHALRTGDLCWNAHRSAQQTGDRGTFAGHQLRYPAENRAQAKADEVAGAAAGTRAQAAGSLGFAERRSSIFSDFLCRPPRLVATREEPFRIRCERCSEEWNRDRRQPGLIEAQGKQW